MILNVVISSSRKQFCDFRPSVAQFFVKFNDSVIFLFSPFVLFNIRVKVIVPPLSTLLAYSTRESSRYLAPIGSPVL